jgi:hypothetical protein
MHGKGTKALIFLAVLHRTPLHLPRPPKKHPSPPSLSNTSFFHISPTLEFLNLPSVFHTSSLLCLPLQPPIPLPPFMIPPSLCIILNPRTFLSHPVCYSLHDCSVVPFPAATTRPLGQRVQDSTRLAPALYVLSGHGAAVGAMLLSPSAMILKPGRSTAAQKQSAQKLVTCLPSEL